MIYQGRVFGLRRDEVVEPSGVRTTREVITHPGSVVVLPVLPDGRIVMIRQYRHATRQYLWELVAGRKEPEETPKQGAAGEAQAEEDEKIEVRTFKLKELKQMIKSGRLRDAKSIAGILYYLTFLR